MTFSTATAKASEATPSLAELVERRYRSADIPLPKIWNETLATILAHRSVRRYLPDALDAGTLELIATAAQSAPTTSNLQAYSIIAVEDPLRKARLAELAATNRHILTAPLLLLFVADLARLRQVSAGLGKSGDGLDYVESFLVAAIDAALAAQAAIIAAESLGLGTCLIGGMRNHPEAVAAEVGLPLEAVVVFGLTVGRPDPASTEDTKPRLPPQVVLHRERYHAAAPADLAAYNDALRRFQAEQQQPPIDWTEQASNRIGSAAALKGRDRLADTLRGLGFGLK